MMHNTPEKMEFDSALFAHRVDDLVANHGKDAKTIASELGIEAPNLSKYRRGNAIPPLSVVVKLAQYFGVSTNYLVGMDDPDSTNPTEAKIYEMTGLRPEALRYLGLLKAQDNQDIPYSEKAYVERQELAPQNLERDEDGNIVTPSVYPLSRIDVVNALLIGEQGQAAIESLHQRVADGVRAAYENLRVEHRYFNPHNTQEFSPDEISDMRNNRITRAILGLADSMVEMVLHNYSAKLKDAFLAYVEEKENSEQ